MNYNCNNIINYSYRIILHASAHPSPPATTTALCLLPPDYPYHQHHAMPPHTSMVGTVLQTFARPCHVCRRSLPPLLRISCQHHSSFFGEAHTSCKCLPMLPLLISLSAIPHPSIPYCQCHSNRSVTALLPGGHGPAGNLTAHTTPAIALFRPPPCMQCACSHTSMKATILWASACL